MPEGLRCPVTPMGAAMENAGWLLEECARLRVPFDEAWHFVIDRIGSNAMGARWLPAVLMTLEEHRYELGVAHARGLAGAA